MLAFLQPLWQPRLVRRLSYADARRVLEDHKRDPEHALGTRPGAEPEMLYYWAENGDATARSDLRQ